MAAAAPLVALQDVALAFGPRPLFAGLSLAVLPGERCALVGRNGTGKSTLLKVLAGEQELDAGSRVVRPGTRIAYLPQDPHLPPEDLIGDHVAGGLPAGESEAARHAVDAVLVRLVLDPSRPLDSLSGGERRRVALARALVGAPELLLLDEPTNHLDLPTIEWLETEIARFPGAVIVISHDRRFLERTSQAVLWLDRGQVRRLDQSFAAFDAWAERLRSEEAQALRHLERRIEREEQWLQRGVTARRRRNQGRLARLRELREARAGWLQAPGAARLELGAASAGGKLAIEARHLSKSFRAADGRSLPVVRDFSTRIRRGERIGVIGPNGAGKSTLVRLLIGQLAPDDGELRLGANLQPIYFDQRREQLDEDVTPWQILAPDGGDSVIVHGRQKHVVAYLKDFLFEEGQARQPVRSLSGGERSRLLLARLFTRPGNLIVLDEPTNDLDMETLDLLTELLEAYDGTLILVSHDRDFLDRLVASVIAVEGGGRVTEWVGGYSDYERRAKAREAAPARQPSRGGKSRPGAEGGKPAAAPRKLGYQEQRELDRLPGEIKALGAAVARLEAALGDPDLYAREPARAQALAAELQATRGRLEQAEERWLELEQRREELAAGHERSA